MVFGSKNSSISGSLMSLLKNTLGRDARRRRRQKRCGGLAYSTLLTPSFDELEFSSAQEKVRAELEHELSVAFDTYAKVGKDIFEGRCNFFVVQQIYILHIHYFLLLN
jgi:hypothetical protein